MPRPQGPRVPDDAVRHTNGRTPRDRRRRAVEVTDAGRRAAMEAGRVQPAEDVATRGLDPEQVTALRELLVAMARAQQAPTADPPGEE